MAALPPMFGRPPFTPDTTPTKWLVPGMDVAVLVDPADADNVEIAWDQLPSTEARVAAGDPALVDPIGAELKVSRARGRPPSQRGERLKEALAAAAAAPASRNRLCAVVMVATIRGRYSMDAGTRDHSTSYRNESAAVLSVNVPGRAPYAVFEPKFKCPKGKEAAVSQELPALVSADDPSEIAVLWADLSPTRATASDSSATAPPAGRRARRNRPPTSARPTARCLRVWRQGLRAALPTRSRD